MTHFKAQSAEITFYSINRNTAYTSNMKINNFSFKNKKVLLTKKILNSALKISWTKSILN